MVIKALVSLINGEDKTDKGEFAFESRVENAYDEFVAALELLTGPLANARVRANCLDGETERLFVLDNAANLAELSEFTESAPSTVVNIEVTVAAAPAPLKVTVAASLRGAASGDATFEFSFQPNQEAILQAFKEACATNLGIDGPSDTSVYIQTEDFEAEVNSDRVFLELLSQHVEAGAVLNAGLQKNVATPTISLKVKCTMEENLATKQGEFIFAFTMNQEQLLESLKNACGVEFDLHDDAINVSIVIEDETIAIQSDQQLRDILFNLLGVSEISIIVAMAAPKVPTHSIPVDISSGDVSSQFTFRYSLDDANVLSHFKSECAIEIDLSTQEEYTLEIIDAGESVGITSDKQLEDVFIARVTTLTAEGAISAVTAKLIPVTRVVKNVKKVACTMDGETAAIDFAYTDGQGDLLPFLIEECKGPFELFPNDEVLLYVILDNEEIPLIMESQLIEILTNYEGGVLNLRMIDAKDAPQPAPKEKTVMINVNQDDEVTQISITYDPVQVEELLERIQNEAKVELFIETDKTIAIYIVNGNDRQLLNNVDQIICHEDGAQIAAEVQILGEVAQDLDRQGELEVLSYEWSDILENTFDAQDVHQVFGLLKTAEGVSLPASDPLNVHLTDFASKNRPQPISELLPILTHWTGHMNDSEVAGFCHQCRDVVDFMVSVSNTFRLRRALSAAFRSLAVSGQVSTQELSRLLLDTGKFEPEAVEHVVDGSPSKLSQIEFSEVMTQLLGDRPQDIVDFLSAAKDLAHPSSRRAEKEIGVLRRKRLRGDILHTLDGVSPFVLMNLVEDFGKSTDATALSLFRAVASLLTAPCTREEQVDDIVCRDWVLEAVKDEDSAKEFIVRLSHYTNSGISQRRLTDVCHRLLSPELEPSALLQHSTGCWAIGRWALKAAQLVCHNKRVPFPPVPLEKFIPKAPVLDSPVRPSTSGLSSPSRLRAQLQATRSTGAVVVASPPAQSRYDFRYSHMVNNDIGLTEDMPTYSLKDLLPPPRKVGDDDETLAIAAPVAHADDSVPEPTYNTAEPEFTAEQLAIEEKAAAREAMELAEAEQKTDGDVKAASINANEEEL